MITPERESVDVTAVVSSGPVIPVIVIERTADALPLARAMLAGGLRVLEVTLRTPAALDAIRAIASELPEIVIGAGTVLNPDDLVAARKAGARFAVSPGTSPALLAAARDSGLAFLPGAVTPSEIMAAEAAGYTTLKFFPAMPAGGVAMLQALSGPFPRIRFCPTGGIGPADAPGFLALANVCCVGGSWIAPPARIARGDWAGIEKLARRAQALRK